MLTFSHIAALFHLAGPTPEELAKDARLFSLILFCAFCGLDFLIFFIARLLKKQRSKEALNIRQSALSPKLTAWTATMLVLLNGLFLAAFILLGGTIARHSAIAWLGIAFSCAISGFWPTFRAKKLSPFSLLAALFIATEIAIAVFYPRYYLVGIASPELRFLVAAPLAGGLILEVAACLTYLFTGEKNANNSTYVERLIAWRFVRAKKTAALSTVTFISIFGVTLGVALMIVSIGVLSGFERDMIEKMIGANAHLTASTYEGYQITDYDEKVKDVEALDQVVAAYPYLMGEVMVASDTNLAGAMLFGVRKNEAAKVINIFDHVELGDCDFLDPDYQGEKKQQKSPLPGITIADTTPTKILIGTELMRILSADIGDTIRIVSPIHEELSPIGPIPKSRSFVVGGIFNSRMYEYDSKFMYIPLSTAQAFFDTPETVSGIGIRLKEARDTERIAPTVLKTLGGYPHRIHDWKRKNEALLASVELEKVVTFVVLIFIVLVASFSIINTLTMSVMEKGQAIALLKSMGASDLTVMKVFVFQGLIIGALGTLLGTLLGITLCYLTKTFGVWLDPEVYYIDELPVYLEVLDVVLIVVSALAITFLAAVFPSRLAERYNPVEGLRDG